jgi:hypothetical protein
VQETTIKRTLILIFVAAVSVGIAAAQQPATHDMGNMQMPGHDMSSMASDLEAAPHAMHSMEDRHMDMGPHMKMTDLRQLKPGDQEKADKVVAAARKVAEKYADYKTALHDGFKIFLPDLRQKHYHFTNYQYFNWMVHVYPLEKDTTAIWSVERQAPTHGSN